MNNLHIHRLAATGAGLALAATGMAISAAPAQADSAPLTYTCAVPLLGPQEFVTTYSVPSSAPVGGVADLTAAVEVPEELVDSIRGLLGGKSVEGDAVVDVEVDDAVQSAKLAIAETDVPSSGSMTATAAGEVALPDAAAPGSTVALAAGNYTVNLLLNKADGTTTGPLAVPCTLNEGQDSAIGTVNVVKAKSTTKVTAKGKKGKAVIKVKVKSETSIKATGKVKVTLKGPKKVTKKVKVNKNGVAKVTVKKLKKGKYKVSAAYSGDKNLEASKGKVKGKVKVK